MWVCLIMGPTLWMVIPLVQWSGMSGSEIAAWVQAVGSIIALIFAVWLPAHARSSERRLAIDGRKSLFLVLLTDLEVAITHNGPGDRAALDEALSASLQKLDVFLSSETDLEIAREVLRIRSDVKKLVKLVDSAYLDVFWDSHCVGPLQSIYEATVWIVEHSPGILPKPIRQPAFRHSTSEAPETTG